MKILSLLQLEGAHSSTSQTAGCPGMRLHGVIGVLPFRPDSPLPDLPRTIGVINSLHCTLQRPEKCVILEGACE